MVTRIEIRQVHPGSVDKKGWQDGTYVTVSQDTVTKTRIDLPDKSGVYDTDLPNGEIELDLSGIGKRTSDKHTLKMVSGLIGGEQVLDVSNGTAHKQLNDQTSFDVSTDALPRSYSLGRPFVQTGFGNLYGE